jgi:Druantia protein DruA
MAVGETLAEQDVLLRYRNREVTAADLEFLRGQCARWGRTELAGAICEAWSWRQANGGLSLYACNDLLLRLEERGLVTLPTGVAPRKKRDRQWLAGLPLPPDLIALTGLELRDPEADLDQLCVRPIADEERLGWRVYMERYHYLGDRPIVGEHLLYAALLGSELVALIGWASAALRAPLREAYVGWDETTKRRRLHLVANNIRFLVLPWIRVRHLASKILAMNLRRLSADWQKVWSHPVYLAETFVETARYRGTCYRAANWKELGQTAGRTKRGNNYLHEGSKKALFVYPLRRDATRRLRGEA